LRSKSASSTFFFFFNFVVFLVWCLVFHKEEREESFTQPCRTKRTRNTGRLKTEICIENVSHCDE
jgi:hypothetical protein